MFCRNFKSMLFVVMISLIHIYFKPPNNKPPLSVDEIKLIKSNEIQIGQLNLNIHIRNRSKRNITFFRVRYY